MDQIAQNEHFNEAFDWIIGLFEKHKMKYWISGGLAAHIHGSDRQIADIDVDIYWEDLDKVLSEIKEHLVLGPELYKDEHFELPLAMLNYKGQEIDIVGVGDYKVFNQENKEWESIHDNLDEAVEKEFLGRTVKLQPLESLLHYKEKLGRDVDKYDVEQLKRRA